AKDAGKVSSVFDYFLSKVTYHQRPENEKTFHALVHMLLLRLGFKVLSEVPGADNRLELFCILPEKVCLIIELKYCPVRTKLNDAAINSALAKEALVRLPKSVKIKALADAVKKKISLLEFMALLNKIQTNFADQDTDEIIADKAAEYLSESEIGKALALAIESALSEDETEEILMKAVPDSKKTPSSVEEEEIMTTLAHAAQRALDDIAARNYHTLVDHLGKSFICLGMAAYRGSRLIKAIFG
ncbi:MAG: hypothetical protein LBP95_00340, partial [Deltaproteobacteria bacterium]|nr:hypothetical protein [Deltaproteobacteria bacterium]